MAGGVAGARGVFMGGMVQPAVGLAWDGGPTDPPPSSPHHSAPLSFPHHSSPPSSPHHSAPPFLPSPQCPPFLPSPQCPPFLPSPQFPPFLPSPQSPVSARALGEGRCDAVMT